MKNMFYTFDVTITLIPKHLKNKLCKIYNILYKLPAYMLQNLQAILNFKTLAYISKLFCNSDEKNNPVT